MASGDSGRTWFPELVDELRESWRPDLSWEAIIHLRDRLQAMVEEIIVTRGIKRARVRCFHCGHVGPGAPPVISVRAVILALQRFGIEPQDAVDRLDKAWAKHRAQQQLDVSWPTGPGSRTGFSRARAGTRVKVPRRHRHPPWAAL
jgi:hypothetical protein